MTPRRRATDEQLQLPLFGSPSADAAPAQPDHASASVGPVALDPALTALRAKLPAPLRLGTSSWSFPGWAGIVYERGASQRLLARAGLTAYGQHPLLRAVCVDRGLYEPLPHDVLARWAAQVPPDFRFTLKAHEHLTVARFGSLRRHGARRGTRSARFLDAAYATAEVVAPFVEALGARAGTLLFMFPRQSLRELAPRGPERFAERLHAFLRELPTGPRYAIELRSPELLTPDYAAALVDVDAVHCVTASAGLPDVTAQWARARVAEGPELLVRWMLPAATTYRAATVEMEPFDRLVAEDLPTRAAIAQLAVDAAQAGQAVTILVNNKAEGCAPKSVARLAHHLVALLDTPDADARAGPG